MTRLTYNCSAPDGKMKNFFSYAQAKAFVERYGGHIKAIYEPVPEEVHMARAKKARRVVARQPPLQN